MLVHRSCCLARIISLDRAYPNPFNPTTTLNFALPVISNVLLEVIEAGYHSITWNADSYSSGVYFVKMVAGAYVSTQKLILVK